jgi:putative hydrolase of the HAD superfamily
MIKALLFDLDFTLYDQGQFMRGAFHDISEFLKQNYGVGKQRSYRKLINIWHEKKSGYSRLFDDLIDELGLQDEKGLVEKLVDIFHAHKPERLRLYPDVSRCLPELKQKYMLGLITDGHKDMQWTKIKILNIEELFDVIICTHEYGREYYKPSPKAFEIALKKMDINPWDAVYIGDSPKRDILPAKTLGMRVIRVLRGEYKDRTGKIEPDFYISNFRIIEKILSVISVDIT